MEKTVSRRRRPHFGLLSTMRARLIALVLIASLPALALIVYNNIEQRRHDLAEARSEVLSTIRQVSKDHLDLVSETRALLSVLAHTMNFKDNPALSVFLADLFRQQDTYSNIAFIGPDGMLVASAIPFKAPIYAGDRAYFKRAVESLEFSIGDYQVGRLTGVTTINFSYPVMKEGSLKGILFAALPITALEKRLSVMPLQQGQTVILSDSAGTVLARRPHEKKWIGKNLHETEHGSMLLQGAIEGYSRHRGLDGVERVYSYTKLKFSENSSAYVISGIPASAVYAKADRQLARNLLTSALIITFVLLLTLLVSDRLVLRSVRELVAVTRDLGAGKRGARALPDLGSEEFNALAGSLNEMANSLEEREKEAERHLTKIARLNRIYAVLSGINSAIIRSMSRDELLKEACRIAVEHGSFALAWAAFSDDSGQLYPAAWAGDDKEYVNALTEYMSPDSVAKPLAMMAFLEDREIIDCDFENDVQLAPWKELAAKYGYRSVAAFPLRVEGRPVGALSLYSVETSFFNDEEELRLLLELASDTSLGLEKIEKEKRIEYLSRYDTLTGLVNRWVFEDHLNQGISRARYSSRAVAVAMFDIEDFSGINDTLGHSAGDEVLKKLSAYLTASVREGDTVARLGNDNFGVILMDLADREDAVMVAEKLTDGLPASIKIAGEEIFIKVTSGIALYPDDGTTTQELMQNTELAMHSTGSSAAGGAQYYSLEMNLKVKDRRKIANELRGALERKEFELVYQPIVNCEDRTVIGVEALLRWTSGKLGPVSPDRFIPVAEETDLIVPIGEWVLKTAVAQAIEWERRGISGVKLGVNVSVRQLRHPDFLERFKRILGFDFGSRAVKLAIEVTESELMNNVAAFAGTLKEVRALGLQVYIDDFGTGYSSLSYLKELPLDTLKIDRSFVRDLAADSSSMSMAMGIIAIANSLGLEVVAEGVETEEQLAILNDLGCAAAQGFLFSRPQKAALIEPMLLNGRRTPAG